MRVISGYLKGRGPKASLPTGIRPTTGRVKESIFSVLDNLIDFEGIKVIDCFSGSGMLGIECISRGADKVVSIEKSGKTISYQKKLAEDLSISDKYMIVRGDAITHLPKIISSDAYDIIFADPPYNKGLISKFISHINDFDYNGLIVIEHSPLEIPDKRGFELLSQKNYGDSNVIIIKKNLSG
jgi:16S rRNA (guanine966-N2)-methyltransferase